MKNLISGQVYTNASGLILEVIDITEKSVKIKYSYKVYWSDYPVRRKGVVTKVHMQKLLGNMELSVDTPSNWW